jgi:hypothetical protein
MKKTLLILSLLLSSESFSADLKEGLDFASNYLPGKTKKVLKLGLSKNIVRSRLGRPDSKSDNIDTFRIQSKSPNFEVKYNSAKKLEGITYEFVGAGDLRKPIQYEDVLKSVEDKSPLKYKKGEEKIIELKEIGITLSFDDKTEVLRKIDLTQN